LLAEFPQEPFPGIRYDNPGRKRGKHRQHKVPWLDMERFMLDLFPV